MIESLLIWVLGEQIFCAAIIIVSVVLIVALSKLILDKMAEW
jgi:hypothetical protein